MSKRVPLLTERSRRIRVEWAREHRDWDLGRWKQVLWSDEMRALLDGPDGQVRIWRLAKERYNPDCVTPRVQKSAGLMVWGASPGSV